MGFLSPFLLAGAAFLAVPLWLHLRRKRRQTPIEFPSLRYLKAAAARTKRQAKVEDLGLLLLRLLLVALLVLAFARPVVRSNGGWLGTGRTVESVVVIDATASMAWRGDAGTRLDAAKRLARNWINGLDRSDAVALWVLTDRLEKPVPVPIADRGYLFKQLDAVTVSDGSSSLAPVFDAAREWADTRSMGRKELVVITDNQGAAWDWPAEGFFRRSWDRGGVNLAVLAPDSERAANMAIESLEWDRNAVREGSLLKGVVKIVNHGGSMTSDLIECRMNGRTVFRKTLEISAAGSVDFHISLAVPPVNGPVLTGELALAGDPLACDDKWNFALPMRHPLHALVIERSAGIGGGTSPSFFLTRALAAGGAGKATVLDSAAWVKQASDGIGSLWFIGGADIHEAAWKKAREFAQAGGTVVVTADLQPAPLPLGWPVTSGEEVRLPAGRMATRLLASENPLFDGVWSDQSPFPPLPQRIARSCIPADGSRLLATMAGEFPLIVETAHGNGRILWLNASVDRSWGDLPLSPVYVALVQQMARAQELMLESATTAWVGEAWPDISKFGTGATWSVAKDDASASRAIRGGVFDALSVDGKPVWRCAVNVRRAESDLRAVDIAKIQAMLPGKVATGQQGVREWREEIRREIPLWPWLLTAAAVVFLVEGWMSTRAAKQRELAAGGDLPKFMGRMGRT